MVLAWLAACSRLECGPGTEEVDGSCLVVHQPDPANPAQPLPETTPEPPWLVADPEVVSLGEVGLGCTGAHPLTLLDDGGEDLVVIRAEATDGWDVEVELPLRLKVGEESSDLVVSFVPAAEGPAEGTLTLWSNDPRGSLAVPLEATGSGAACD